MIRYYVTDRRQGDLLTFVRRAITAGVNTDFQGIDAVGDAAAELRARYNVSLTDAFQVAAALAGLCDAFLTNDTALRRVTELVVLVLDDLTV